MEENNRFLLHREKMKEEERNRLQSEGNTLWKKGGRGGEGRGG